MSRRALPAAVLLALAACGGGPSLPEEDLLLHVTLGAEEVAPGQGFPVTVVRQWSKDLEPAAWDERALAPLVLRLEETATREDERRIEETRRYRGYAFSRKDVTVPPAKLTARPRSGGPERSTSSSRLRVRVKPTVDAKAPGEPELPGEPLAEPAPRWPWFAGAALVVAVVLIWGWRRRVRSMVVATAVRETPPAHLEPLERLRALTARAPDTAEERGLHVVAAVDVVRDYVGMRYAVRTRERTSEEVLGALPMLSPEDARAALGSLLARADDVKFAARTPTSAERDTFVSDAVAFVTATAAP